MFDENTPVPPIKRGPAPKVNWAAMKVGQSVLVPGDAGKTALGRAQRYAKAAWVQKWRADDGELLEPPTVGFNDTQAWLDWILLTEKRGGNWQITGKKCFTGRKEGDGYRIWRIEDKSITASDTVTADGVKWIQTAE